MTNEDWTALGTVATAVVALLSALFAWLQVRHARGLRVEQAAPVVVVDIAPSAEESSLLNLIVANSGQTVAYDVTFEFTPPLSSTLDTPKMSLAQSDLITRGIPTLPPGRSYTAIFDSTFKRFNEASGKFDINGHASTYEVIVRFRNSKSKWQTLNYRLSLDVYTKLMTLKIRTVHHLAKDIHRLATDFNKAFQASNGALRIQARDGDHRDWQEQWQIDNSGGTYPLMANPQPAGRPSPHKYDYLAAAPDLSRNHEEGPTPTPLAPRTSKRPLRSPGPGVATQRRLRQAWRRETRKGL